MKVIRSSSSAEMVLEWMRAELTSSRFGSDLKKALKRSGADEELITHADITDDEQNARRRAVLRKYRDWFELNVDDYNWQLVSLNQYEVGELEYIDYSYWNELSQGTRLVAKAVDNIRAGVTIFSVPNDNFRAIAAAFEEGQDFPPILITAKQDGSHEIIEGHARATGYVLANDPPRPLAAIIGVSS